uniref:Cell division cycle 6 homolog (S. cerevisiae) n=1 Tax=Seriola lalandi dorsalis TaxID=1841481 RepID=A0A3B4YIL6_SERLL
MSPGGLKTILYFVSEGDDNGCNLGAALLGSPPKQSRPTLASPRKLGFDENSPVTARRQLVPSSPRQPLSPAVALSPRRQETPAGSPARHNSEKKPPVVRLFAESECLSQALHTAVPERLLSREAERASIRSFLEDKVLRRVPGSLYISGAPGTGKTACFNCVLQEMKRQINVVSVFKCFFDFSYFKFFLITIINTVVTSLCICAGIANALDLTDRILPRLQARPHCRPLLLHFPPYSRQELTAIVQDRLAQASADGILDASAVQFCARKVSAVSGDARKALDICSTMFIINGNEKLQAAAKPEFMPNKL